MLTGNEGYVVICDEVDPRSIREGERLAYLLIVSREDDGLFDRHNIHFLVGMVRDLIRQVPVRQDVWICFQNTDPMVT